MSARMDRTVIDVWRAEERELSELLYQKLMFLTTIHSPSKEFRKLLTEDMFLKPNQKALFHVMHYLFMLLDATEFKKRFYWPISDKKSEALFRSSTVQYLNYLNEKHHLNWNQLTNYLVVMPGGLKFISFLIDLVDFIVSELINRSKKVGVEAVAGNKDCKQFNLGQLTRENESFKMHIKKSMKEVIKATEARKKQVVCLKQKLEEISTSHEIPMEKLTSNAFQQEWKSHNISIFTRILNSKEGQSNLEKSLNELRVKAELVLNKETYLHTDKNLILESCKLIETLKPNVDLDCGQLFSKNELNFQEVFQGFFCIMSTVDKMISEVYHKQAERWQDRTAKIDESMLELEQLKGEIINLRNSMRTESCSKLKNTPVRAKFTLENTLQNKFVNTPPITFDIKQLEAKMPRLLLLDDNASQVNSLTFTNQTAFLRHNFSKTVRSTEKHKSKIVDPYTILRTVKRSKHFKQENTGNLSSLGPKWKERELTLDKENQDVTMASAKEPLATLADSSVPKSINSTNDSPAIADKTFIGDVVNYQKRTKGGSVFQESFDNLFLRATTSPSGRLESLIKVDDKNSFNTFVNEKIRTTAAADESDKVENSVDVDYDATSFFADFNEKLSVLDAGGNGRNFIFDVSDTVLRDVSL